MKNPSSPTRRSLLAAAAMIAAGFGHSAIAQENYPTKPVTLIVPFTPGGSNDVIARVIGQRLSQIWNQPRPEASGPTTWPRPLRTATSC